MAANRVDIVRRLIERWNGRDVAGALELIDELIVWDARRSPVVDRRRVYYGEAEFMSFWAEWLSNWNAITVEILWIEGRGDRVVMWVRQTHVGRSSGATATHDYGWDIVVRGDKIIRFGFFEDEDETRAALDE